MLPPALCFPPSWRENFTGVASGRVGDSTALLRCHPGLESAARKKCTGLLLGRVPPHARSPFAHTTAFVILIRLQFRV